MSTLRRTSLKNKNKHTTETLERTNMPKYSIGDWAVHIDGERISYLHIKDIDYSLCMYTYDIYDKNMNLYIKKHAHGIESFDKSTTLLTDELKAQLL